MRRSWAAFFAVAGAFAREARAAGPTPGFPEPVVQWGVQKGETCDDIAKALYGSAKHAGLLNRYNRVSCKSGVPLPEGTTLVLPETVTTIPDAKLRSINPDVRARPPGGGWNVAASGMPLFANSSVNTLDKGRADVEFVDRTRVFLAPNTLVVIYGTANQTQVSKTPPAAVEVEAGEVKAGLAALRGDTVEVAIKGGGRVSAASRDTVVQRKGARTTIAVFNGKAGVTSGGKAVEVPTNFGSRFVGNAAPIPPRPLPPAPPWSAGGTGSITLAPAGQGVIDAGWSAVPSAISYRIELARDETFNDLIAREEVPASIVAFHAEKLPAGLYHLKVRAIDKEEFLGVASTDRTIRIVDATLGGGDGALKGSSINANPYGMLGFGPMPDLEMAIDEGPFGPMPAQIDLQKRAPRVLHLRARGGGGAAENIQIAYTKVSARVEVTPGKEGQSLTAAITLAGFDGVDVSSRVAPHLRAHFPGEEGAPAAVQDFALTSGAAPGLFSVVVPVPRTAAARPIRLDIIDGRGSVLGTTTADLAPPGADASAPAAVEAMPRIGADAPLWSLSPLTDVFWFAPTPSNAASGGVATARADGETVFQGQARASGAIGPLGIDAALRSSATGRAPTDSSAWLGARYRLVRLGLARFELAPALRVGVPLASGGPPTRLEGAIAAGGVSGRFTWLADLGVRVRLRAAAPGLSPRGRDGRRHIVAAGPRAPRRPRARRRRGLGGFPRRARRGYRGRRRALRRGVGAHQPLHQRRRQCLQCAAVDRRARGATVSENDDKAAKDRLSLGTSPTLLPEPAAPSPGSTQLLSPDRPRHVEPATAPLPESMPDPGATTPIVRGQAPPPRDRTLPSAPASHGKAALGTILAGKYELVRQLGSGGMGSVWKAHHLSLGIDVAVKTMHPYVAMQDEYVRRFRREAHAASLLNHPNAVRVLDFGDEGGLLYLVMEYLDGRSLGSWLDSLPGPPPLSEVGRILGALLDAFQVAHTYGIVHRDLKPDNVFLAEVGDQRIIKVLDFGLAHVDDARDSGPTLTQQDSVAGTPDYMSPEQCRSLAVGPSADLYSIGCLLTTLLQLRAPFAGGSSIDTMAKHMFARPPALLRPEESEPVPPLLEKLRLDLLAKVPERRPRDAAETKRRLIEALSPDATEARLPTRKGEVPLSDRSGRVSWSSDPRDSSPGSVRSASPSSVRSASPVSVRSESPVSVRSADSSTIGVVRLQPPAEAVGIGHECETALATQQIEVITLEAPADVASAGVPLVVLDVGSSIPEGCAALAQIRKAAPSTRVIVCAARLGAGQLNELVAAGAADIARYPITPDGLARKIERVLRRGR